MKMRKGFTLVELLIVIIIIGILAAAMLLSSGAATETARASNAIAEMRSMKAAIIIIAANRGGMGITQDLISLDAIIPYMDVKFNKSNFKEVEFNATSGIVSLDVSDTAPAAYAADGIRQKIRENAATDDATGQMVFNILTAK